MNEALILEALARIEGEIAGLRADLAAAREGDRRPANLDVADRRRLGALLPVIHGQLGGEPFAVWEIFDTVDQGGVAGTDLRLALGPLRAHALGKLLGRASAAGAAVAGYSVRALGRDTTAGGRRWIVEASALTGDAPTAMVRATDRRR